MVQAWLDLQEREGSMVMALVAVSVVSNFLGRCSKAVL